MEVILPPTFDKGLLVFNKSRCNYTIVYDTDPAGKHTNFYYSPDSHPSKQVHQYLDNTPNKGNSNSNNVFYHPEAPPNAVWTTNSNIKNCEESYPPEKFIITGSNPTKLYPNFTNLLATIPAMKEPFSGFPQSEYCVIQNQELFSNYQLEYPSDMIKYLNSPMEEYNGELTYKIIRRKVLLIKLVGKALINNKKFQDLLMVNCDSLNPEVTAISAGLNIPLYRCHIVERPVLLDLLHAKLFPQTLVSPVVSPGIISDIAKQVERLDALTSVMNNIYVVSDEISRLRNVIGSSDRDSIQNQLVDSSATISKLRCDLRTANSEITQLKSELGSADKRIDSLNVQIATSEKTGKFQDDKINQLSDEVFKLNKKINILEINAAKDESLIHTLRAEKAFWNVSTTRNFEDEQKRSKEIQELKERLNAIL